MRASTTTMQWLRSYYEAFDSLRFEEVAEYLHEDCRVQYASGSVITGRERLIAQARRALESLDGIQHVLEHAWEEADEVIFELEVTYRRKDGRTIIRPGTGIFVLAEGKIREQRLFVDAAGVWD